MRHATLPKVALLALLAGGAALLAASCEDSDDNRASALAVTPTSARFASTVVTNISFTASGGFPPYAWSVSDTDLGSVVAAGNAAIYTSEQGQDGRNFVIVTDLLSNSVSAVITQF